MMIRGLPIMLRNLIRWAKITMAGNDTDQFHVQQLEYLGKTANTVMVFPFGLHANVSPESLALMFSVQDNPENRASIAWSPKNRPVMASGEVTFYHPETNSIIAWREGGKLQVKTASDVDLSCANATVTATESVSITTPTLTLNGNLVVNGTMTNNGKDVGDTHGHAQGNDSGGNTETNINGVL